MGSCHSDEGSLNDLRYCIPHPLPQKAPTLVWYILVPITREEVLTVKNVRKMVLLSLLIAMQIVLTRFFSIHTPIVRIGFSFLPLAIASIMFGPLLGGIAAAVADIIGMMLFPTGGAYFPGFTISAFLTGAIYGILLYKKPKKIYRTSIAVIAIAVFVNIGLGSLWVTMLTGNAIVAILPARIIKSLIMIPIEIIMIQVVWDRVINHLKFFKTNLVSK